MSPKPPPCAVCGMPAKYMRTEAHSAEHARIAALERQPQSESGARAWLAKRRR